MKVLTRLGPAGPRVTAVLGVAAIAAAAPLGHRWLSTPQVPTAVPADTGLDRSV